MANNTIKKHNFELAKNRIKSLASQVPPSVSLESFRTDGSILRFTSHKVTGKEINENLVDPLQKKLIDQNNHIRNLYNAADEVYKALDLLDKEYVSGIEGTAEAAALASDQALAASKNAQKASNQALDASSQALDASKKATTAQADIKRTIEALQTTVRILKEFKEKVTKDFTTLSLVPNQITSINMKLKFLEQSNDGVHKQVDEFVNETHDVEISIRASIEELANSQQEKNILVDKKIKIAYAIAGGSVFLSLIQLILHLLDIL